jgi:hypothetical protein
MVLLLAVARTLSSTWTAEPAMNDRVVSRIRAIKSIWNTFAG